MQEGTSHPSPRGTPAAPPRLIKIRGRNPEKLWPRVPREWRTEKKLSKRVRLEKQSRVWTFLKVAENQSRCARCIVSYLCWPRSIIIHPGVVRFAQINSRSRSRVSGRRRARARAPGTLLTGRANKYHNSHCSRLFFPVRD